MGDDEEEERLCYIKAVTKQYVVCSNMLENLQSAHYSMLKVKQQAQHLSHMPMELTQKLESHTREQASLLHEVADHKVQLERCLHYAQLELLTPIVYLQPRSPNSEGTDEELRDVRANVFPHSE